jgi:hypothetical protein
MIAFTHFIGGSYVSRSPSAADSRLVNLYTETVESGDGSNTATMYGCPGLLSWLTLPTSPIRGIWIGENRCFVAAGSHYYEVFYNRTYTDRGSIGADTTPSSPVQIFPNGTQVMIIAGGYVYIDTGTTLVQPYYSSAQGTVTTSGTAVNCTGGDYFDASMIGSYMLIAGAAYKIASLTDSYNLVLATSAGTQTNVAYSMPLSGTVAVSGSTVTWVSGDQFDYGMYGGSINIGGTSYPVAHVNSLNTVTITITGSLAAATLDYWAQVPVTASCGAVLDGYFIVATPSTKQFNISAPNDGTHWDPIDKAVKEGYPDNIAALLVDHEELYVFGTQTAEVWTDSGNADFPLQRNAGAVMHLGNVAPNATVRCTASQSVKWLGGDPQGQVVAYAATGYQPVRISTHAQEYAWSQYSTVADAEAFVYELDGHEFWHINFPTANTTWVYDGTERVWHERQYSAGGQHRARCHGYVFGFHLVGDYQTGVLYKMANTYYDDNGTAILGIRRCPHVTTLLKRKFYAAFRLEMEPATGLTVTLSWSNDAGKTFNTAIVPSGTKVSNGDLANVVAQEWRRLGSGRDRVFELQISATSRIAIVNVGLEAS